MTSKFITLVDAAIAFIEGSTLATQLEADVKECLAELESVTKSDLETAVTTIGTAVLGSLASTDSVSLAIAAGIAAAPGAFAAAGKDISVKTTNTLVTSIVNSLNVPKAA